MVVKLLEATQEHWRFANGANMVALVRRATSRMKCWTSGRSRLPPRLPRDPSGTRRPEPLTSRDCFITGAFRKTTHSSANAN